MTRLPAVARVAVIASAAMIAQQVAGKATRDALYLSSFSATTLPPMMGVSAVASLVAALWLSRMLTRYTPARVVPLGFGVGSVVLLVIWGASFLAPRLSAIALYLYTGVFSGAMIAAFWALINETFDPHTSRRVVTAITSGGALGGLVGGLAVWRLSSMVAVPTMLPGLAAANALCMWGTWKLKGSDAKGIAVEALTDEPVFPFRVLREAPYLRNLAAIVALGAVTQGLLDYLFSAAAAKTFAKGPALLSFFSLFWVAVGALSFVRQAIFGRLALRKLGLALSMALLPATVVLTGAVALAVPGLASTSALRGGEALNRNSFFRAAYEMLYTPVSERKKRAIKTVIDVGFDRLGTMTAAGLAWLAVCFAGPHTATVLLALTMVCALVTLARSRPIHLGYVPALEESLRRRGEESGLSATTSRQRPPSVAVAPQAVMPLEAHDQLSTQELSDLASTDLDRARRALSAEKPLARTSVAFAILRLADKPLHDVAVLALRRVAPLITGQLADVLCDPHADPAVRRSVPRVLSECSTPQVADALLRGAEDGRFDVRYECVRALLEITKKNPALAIPHDRLIALVRAEVSLDRDVWKSQPGQPLEDGADRPALIKRLQRDRIDRRLEHVFHLLALNLDRESLVIAFKALHSGDERLRGTALEYLDTVLPDEIRDAVWPYLGEERPMRRARDVSEILADLQHLAPGVRP